MNPAIVDRDTFLQNLRISKLLTNQQFRMVVDKLGDVHDSREIAKALVSWKLLTKFQAKMLLRPQQRLLPRALIASSISSARGAWAAFTRRCTRR